MIITPARFWVADIFFDEMGCRGRAASFGDALVCLVVEHIRARAHADQAFVHTCARAFVTKVVGTSVASSSQLIFEVSAGTFFGASVVRLQVGC